MKQLFGHIKKIMFNKIEDDAYRAVCFVFSNEDIASLDEMMVDALKSNKNKIYVTIAVFVKDQAKAAKALYHLVSNLSEDGRKVKGNIEIIAADGSNAQDIAKKYRAQNIFCRSNFTTTDNAFALLFYTAMGYEAKKKSLE